MKSKFITALIIILIVLVIFALCFWIFRVYTDSKLASNNDVNNVNIDVSKNQSEVDSNNNLGVENQTVIEPIINSENTDNGTVQPDSFAATYYYSQLNETGKAIYDGLKDNKANLSSGNYVIDYGTKFNTLLNSEGGEDTLDKAFQAAWDAFTYDNVDLFYIDSTKVTITKEYYSIGGIKTYKITIGPGNNSNYFRSTFKTKEEVEEAKNYLENIRKQMSNQISSDDIYNKLAKVHNWLIHYISYENRENSGNEHTIYGTLKTGKAVCEGYARTFKYLIDDVGIPCILVSGTATNSEGQVESHAWNYVQINGKWYAIDVTWDDPVIIGNGELTKELKYKYFLKGSEEFMKDHKEDGNISKNSFTFSFPILSTENYSR